MDRETIDLLEKAFRDAFAAGEARGTNPASLGWMTCWLLWRAMYIDHQEKAEAGIEPAYRSFAD